VNRKIELLGASLSTVAKATAVSSACNELFGFNPVITLKDTQAKLTFTPDQYATIRKYLVQQALSPDIGDIDIDVVPIIAPFVIGLGAVSFLAGIVAFYYLTK
jgi:hypothetical protein